MPIDPLQYEIFRSPQVTSGHLRSPQVTSGHLMSPQVTSGHLKSTSGHIKKSSTHLVAVYIAGWLSYNISLVCIKVPRFSSVRQISIYRKRSSNKDAKTERDAALSMAFWPFWLFWPFFWPSR